MGTGAGCFPSGSIVHTEEGPRDIAALKKGDRVLAADDDGKMVYSEVSTLKLLTSIITLVYAGPPTVNENEDT